VALPRRDPSGGSCRCQGRPVAARASLSIAVRDV
jgi:hypothetical protein